MNSTQFSAAEKRKAAKAKAAAAESKEKDRAASRESARAVVAADDEPLPATPEEREAYFMENLQKGEMLFRQGDYYSIGMT